MTRCLLVIVVVLSWPAGAAAQGQAGPFGGLFGRTPERIGKEFTALEFRSTVRGQYDDALLDSGTPSELVPQGGPSGGGSAGLSFERSSDRLRLKLHGSASHQQFFREPVFAATSYDTGALLMAQVATRLALDASVGYRRSPFYHLVPDASGGLPAPIMLLPTDVVAASRLDHDTIEAMAGFTSAYSRRSTLSASVSRRSTRFYDLADNDFEVWGAQGTWRRRLSRSLAARVAYGREETRPAAGTTRFVHETIDVGIDFERAISLARRTGLTFTTQTSAVREAGGERRYRLNGGALLTRGFQRTWLASLGVNRDTDFLPGFLQPVFSEGVSASLAGMLSTRIEWSATAGARRGQVGFDNPDDFITYTGSSRLAMALNRRLGIHAEYTYYRYELPVGSSPVVLLPRLSRQAVSAGFSVYAPIFTRMRTPRDPR